MTKPHVVNKISNS